MGEARADQAAEVPPRRLTKGQRTRRRIFDAALDLFGRRGFQAVSLRDIAAAVGVTHVTVLHYFASKDELLTELMLHRDEVEREAMREFLEAQSEHDPPHDGVRTPVLRWFMHRLHRNAEEYGAAPLFLRISTEATDPEHPAHEHFVRRYDFVLDALTRAFEEEFALRADAGRGIAPRTAAQHLVGIADGTQVQAIYAQDRWRVVDDAWSYLRLLGLTSGGVQPDR